jgi:hypothetical protein
LTDLLLELKHHPEAAGALAKVLGRLGFILDEPDGIQMTRLGPVVMEGACVSAVADELVASDLPSLRKLLEINGEAPYQKFFTACELLRQLGYQD